MARQRESANLDELDQVAESAEEAQEKDDEVVREVGTIVEARPIPFEVRKDRSIAYFTHEHSIMQREAGS